MGKTEKKHFKNLEIKFPASEAGNIV